MKVYNVAIIGVGNIAKAFHIPAINKIENCKLFALCDTDQTALSEVGKDNNLDSQFLYLNYDSLLRNINVDVVLIATPNKFHCLQAIKALNSNKHVLVEKPFALNYYESTCMINAAVENNKSIMCLHHNRFKDCSIQSKKIIDSGTIGEIFYSKASVLLRDDIPKEAHYLDNTASGGGPLYDIGYHFIDLAWWMMGMPRPSYVVGKLWRHNNINIINSSKCEDFAIGNIYFEDGSSLFIESSYSAKIKKDQIECSFFGTKGSLSWPMDNFILVKNNNTLQGKIPFSNRPVIATIEQVKHFLNMIEVSEESYIEDSSTVVRIIDKIIESSNSKQVVYF